MDAIDYVSMRVWKKTHKVLRLIAAHTEESIVEVLERLAKDELRRVQLNAERHDALEGKEK